MLGTQTGIQQHADTLTAAQLSRAIRFRLGLTTQRLFLTDQALVLLHQHRLRLHQHLATVAIDHQQPFMQQGGTDIRPHHCRHPHRSQDDRRMGVRGAVAHHHPQQTGLRDLGQQTRRQLVGDQNEAIRPRRRADRVIIQMEQQTLAKRAEIAGALAHVAILQAGELCGEMLRHLLHRPLRHRAAIHVAHQLAFQTRIIEQVRVEIEDRRALFLCAGTEAFTVAAKLAGRLFQGPRQTFALTLRVQGRGLIDMLQRRLADIHPPLTHRDPGRGGDSAQAVLA